MVPLESPFVQRRQPSDRSGHCTVQAIMGFEMGFMKALLHFHCILARSTGNSFH